MKYFNLFLKKNICLLVFIFFAFNTQNSYSQISGGGTYASFLLRPTGTRPIALAGSYVAISNDPYAIFYNPAGLASCAPVAMFATSISLLQFNRLHSNISYSQSFGNLGIGAALNSYTTGNIIARNQKGDYLGNLTNYNFNLILGAAYSSEFASFGAAMKYLNNSLQGDDYYSNSFAIDFGSKFNIMDLFTFGLVVQNIASIVKSSSRSQPTKIPYTIRTGIATEFQLSEGRTETFRNQLGEIDSVVIPPSEYLLLTFDINFTQYEKYPNLIIGLELSPSDFIAIRSGIALFGEKWGKLRFLPMNAFGGGISIKPNIESFPNLFSIDFSIGNDYLSKQNIFYSVAVLLQF